MKIIRNLKTQRKTWTKAELYKTPAEAREAGLGIIYEDKEGIVFGSSSDGRHWEKVGFVPYPGYYDKYEKIAEDTQKNFDKAFITQVNGIKVTVVGGDISEKERNAYIERAKELYPERKITSMNIEVVDDENVDIEYHYGTTPFTRIRRITGYLVGDMDRFNNAKAAEVRDRVKHGLAQQSFDDIYEEEDEEEDDENEEDYDLER